MSALLVIINAIFPIAFVILLGVLAGRIGLIDPKSNGILATLALNFCLPSLLFVATATLTMAELRDWRFFVGITLGLLVVYSASFVLSLKLFHKPATASSLQALNSAYPNMAFMGVPLLTAVVGSSALLSVVVGNLISSFILLPVTLTFLQPGSAEQSGRKSVVIWHSLLGAVKQPLVWAPLAGMMIALTHIPFPAVANKSFTLIGEATSGVALFAMGLLLSGHKLKIGMASASNVVFKILIQPGVMWGLAIMLGVTGAHRREMILLGALPAASMTAMFAVQYKVYQEESNASILVSTVLSIATLGVIVALTTSMTG